MPRRIPLGCALLAVLWSAEARAEPFTILPNGQVAFDTALTTSGVFRCQGTIACSGSGTNSITLGSGDNQATITFTGVTRTFQVTNVAQRITVGTFDVTSTPGFTYPERGNPNLPVLRFGLIYEHTMPTPGHGTASWTFGPGGGSMLPILTGIAYVGLPLDVNPPNVGYAGFVYTVRPFPFSLPGSGSLDLAADVGVVPEPGTILLVGSGIAGVIGARRRRRSTLR
jgi:PEP-CTERM motif-containing protein